MQALDQKHGDQRVSVSGRECNKDHSDQTWDPLTEMQAARSELFG